MKAARFEYERVASVQEASGLLALCRGDAKLIAGGQSLVPMMAMRLVRPCMLIDIIGIAELQAIDVGDDFVGIGACVRQVVADRDRQVRASLPVLGRALHWVGHVQTRNRGTVGGSIAHADPCAEVPMIARMLDATMVCRDENETVEIAADRFFSGPMSNAMSPDQCLVQVRFPVWRGGGVGSAVDEVSIRHGDFAIVAAAAQVQFDAGGKCIRAAIGIGGAAPVPLSMSAQAALLAGTRLEEGAIEAAARAVGKHVDPGSDLHASADYRRRLASVLTARVLRQARDEALNQSGRTA